MKKLLGGAMLAVLGMAALAPGQPDPRDSIILESKTVYPGAHPGSASDTAAFVYFKIYITNKDSLTAIDLPLEEVSTSGGAYMTLGWPRNFNGCVNRLTNTLNGTTAIFLYRYHSNSPDTLYPIGVFDPLNPSSIEPPNPVRKAFWELKFDTVFSNPGTIEVDSVKYNGNEVPTFTNTVPRSLMVNFLKSTVTVVIPQKGDLNLDGVVSPADVAVMLNYKYLGSEWPC